MMFGIVGNEGLEEYVADVKASNRTKGQKGKTAPTAVVSGFASADNRISFEGPSTTQGQQPHPSQLEFAESLAESLPSQLSLAKARAEAVSLDVVRGGKVTLPPLPPGVVPRKRAASASGVDVHLFDGPDSESSQPKPMQHISLPGSTGAPISEGPPVLPLDPPPASSAALEAAPSSPTHGVTFKQMNAAKPKGTTKRAPFGSMYMPAAHSSINRPTYAQDAVDEDNADAKASGIFSVWVPSLRCYDHHRACMLSPHAHALVLWWYLHTCIPSALSWAIQPSQASQSAVAYFATISHETSCNVISGYLTIETRQMPGSLLTLPSAKYRLQIQPDCTCP